MPAARLTLVFLGLLVAACSSDKDSTTPPPMQQAEQESAATPQSGGGENVVFEDDNPGLPAEDVSSDGNITFTDSFADPAGENITFEPLDVPEADFSQAVSETESGDDTDAATNLAAVGDGASGNLQFAARGTLSGKDTDLYRLFTEGEPQLWYIEVTGEGLSRVAYVDAADQRHVAKKMKVEGGEQFVIANLFLPPGEHRIRVQGDDIGDYTVRAVALGPPDRHSELEPNDDKSRARAVPVNTTVAGLIYPERDEDFYRFSLFAEELVAIRFQPPPELSAQVELIAVETGGSTNSLMRWRSSEPGQRMDYFRVLAPGDYLVPVGWNGSHSKEPYRLRVERLDPWSVPADLEPNNEASDARPLRAGQNLQGSVSGADDDWFRLPVAASLTTVTIRPVGPPPQTLQLFEVGKESRKSLLQWNRDGGVYEGELPAGLQTNLQIRGGGPYELDLAFDPPISGAGPGKLPVEITITPMSQPFAAYLDRSQEAPLQAVVTNRGDDGVDLQLEAFSSHYDWRPALAERGITLAPGESQTVDMTVHVASDAGAGLPVRISLGARGPSGRAAGGSTSIVAACEAEPVNPANVGPLPRDLLGNLNAASSAFGARVFLGEGDEGGELGEVNDGMTPTNSGWFFSAREYPVILTADLAGDESVPIAGVLLHPLTSRSSDNWVREFDILVSEDGTTFNEVYSGTLQRIPVEQAFVFDKAVPARFARLRIRSTQSGQSHEVSLGEWKVVAAEGSVVAKTPRYNLANPALGGHVVWTTWKDNYTGLESMLTEDDGRSTFRADPNLPNQWVVGFQHDRAAQIEELQWHDSSRVFKPLTMVQIAVSTESPIGPWQPAGTWELERGPDGVRPFRFEAPAWARFVRLSTTEPDRPEDRDLPKTLRIIERPAGDDYRSILGEWGHYSRAAAFELQRNAVAVSDSEAEPNDSRERAHALNHGEKVRGTVTLGEDTDWYAVEVPAESNTLRVSLTGAPLLKARAALVDASGEPIPDVRTFVEPLRSFVETPVAGGETVYVRVEEPPRAVAFVWDNSGSVARYRETIYQAMSRFSGEVKPGLEFGNLLPFQDKGGSFLLPSWSDQPHVLQATLNNYDRKAESSEAESALLVAAKAFERWNGTRAAIFLTDAETTSYRRTARLWNALAEAQPHIFALHLHTGSDKAAARQQDLMQGWASVNGGHYTYFRAQADLDAGFERAACYIRRPASYLIEAEARYEEPPGPGSLSVEAGDAIAANAVELILDASGSMLQRLEGKRRIEIARSVLTDLVNETIPAGTMLALRVFGHRKPDACDTDLAVPLQPLERGKVASVIQSTQAMNLARTPIGESLARVADDLESVKGQKLIILITDGEETCDGDPADSIAELKAAGHDVRVNIVGFAIDDAALEAEFESWARMGGGLYFNAGSAKELDQALKDAMRPKFQVLDETGAIIAAGTTGTEELELPSGSYTVKILTSPVQTFDEVRIEPEQTTQISAGYAEGENLQRN